MPPSEEIGDDRRRRAGVVLLVAGTMLLVWAWGSWVYRTSDTPDVQHESVSASPDTNESRPDGIDTWVSTVAIGIAVLMGLTFVGYMIMRRSGPQAKWSSESET